MEQGSSGDITFKYFSTGALTSEVGSVLINKPLHGTDAHAHFHTLSYLKFAQMDADEQAIMEGADRWVLTKGGSTRTVGAPGWLYEDVDLESLFMMWMFDNSSPTPDVYKLAPSNISLRRASMPALLVYRAKLPETPMIEPVSSWIVPDSQFFPYQPFLNRLLKERDNQIDAGAWAQAEYEAEAAQKAITEAATVRQIILDSPDKADLQEAFLAELRAIHPDMQLSFS